MASTGQHEQETSTAQWLVMTKSGSCVELLLSARGSILLLLWLCNVSLYLSRSNISVAILSMYPNNEDVEGELLAAFYCGYCFQTIGGVLAARYGGKPVLVGAVFAWSMASGMTALLGTNRAALFALRAVVGLAEGCNYPSQMEIISLWVPYDERATAWALMSTGESVGTILALLGGPFLVQAAGWPSIFLVSGGLGGLWVALFTLLGSSSPSAHRFISRAEFETIVASRPPRPPIERTPWAAIFRCRPFLAVVATHCCFNWSSYFALSWTDKFFKSAFSVNYSSLGLLSVLPYLVLFAVSAAAGRAADMLESRRAPCNRRVTAV